jgi:hypothetical protein
MQAVWAVQSRQGGRTEVQAGKQGGQMRQTGRAETSENEVGQSR